MAEPLVLPKFPGLEANPAREDLEEGLATFRAEFDHCDDRGKKAALAHHLAGLLARSGDVSGAARDELSATNLAPGFTAPVESLIRLAVENHSAANLDRLLSRLLAVATEPAERERARLHQTFVLLSQGRLAEALSLAEQNLAELPDSAPGAIALDLVAARTGDETARLNATQHRAAATHNPELRALLLERVARQLEQRGDLPAAQAALEQSVAVFPRLATLRQLESLTRRGGNFLAAAEVALRTAELLEQAPLSGVAIPEAAVLTAGAEAGKTEITGPATPPARAPIATEPRAAQAARLRAALYFLEEGDLVAARGQLEIAAYDEHAGLFEGSLLFALALLEEDPLQIVAALERALALCLPGQESFGPGDSQEVSARAEAGRLHLLTMLHAGRAGDEDRAEQHRREAQTRLAGTLTAPTLELLDLAKLGDLAGIAGLIGRLASGEPSAPGAANRAGGTASDLRLTQAALFLAAGQATPALHALEEAEQAGLSRGASAALKLGLHRGAGQRDAELALLRDPPASLPLAARLAWVLDAIRLTLLAEAEGTSTSSAFGSASSAFGSTSSASGEPGENAATTTVTLVTLLTRLRRERERGDDEKFATWDERGATGRPVNSHQELPSASFDQDGRTTAMVSWPELDWIGSALATSQLALDAAARNEDTATRPTRTAVPAWNAKETERDLALARARTLGALLHPDVPQAELATEVSRLIRLRAGDEAALGAALRLGGTSRDPAVEARLLQNLAEAILPGREADAARLRAGLLLLGRVLHTSTEEGERGMWSDGQREATEAALALLGPLTAAPEYEELQGWLERTGRSLRHRGLAAPAAATGEADALVQLEGALGDLEQGDIATTSILALSRLDEPRSGAAQLLRLLLSLGLSADQTRDVVDADPLLEDDLKAELVLVSSFLTEGPREQLSAAQNWVHQITDVGTLLTLATCARLAKDQVAEAAARRALAERLGSPELIAEQDARQALGSDVEEASTTAALLQLAASGTPHQAAAVCWELLERLNRRSGHGSPRDQRGPWSQRENSGNGEPTDSLWRERHTVLAQLAGALRAAASLSPGESPAPEKEAAEADAAAAELQAAFLALSVDEDELALRTFESLLVRLPDDESLYLGLRVAAARTRNAALEARASAELARRSPDHRAAADLWERAGSLYHDVLDRPDLAQEAFSAAMARLPGSPLAFVRLYELASVAGDRDRMIELIDVHLPTVESDRHQIELLWEKARYCRSLGRPAAALTSLTELLRLDDRHLPALALAAELHLVDRRLETAATTLRAIALHPDTPQAQRSDAGLHAAELLEELHRPKEALALLDELERRGTSENLTLERKARAAALAGQWDVAYGSYRRLAEETDVISERLQAARIMLAIVRDHLASPDELKDAARLVLRDSPTDDDAVSVVLRENFNTEERSRLLGPALEECLGQLRRTPLDAARIARLCELTERGANATLERVGLGMLSLTGALRDAQATRFAELTQRARTRPSAPLARADLQTIASPGQLGTFSELGQKAAPVLREVALPSLAAMGVTESMRVDPFGGPHDLEECEAFCSSLTLGDHHVYVGGAYPEAIMVLPGDLPTILIGGDVPLPLEAASRARLSYLAFSHLLGTGLLLQMPFAEAKNWLTALFRLNSTAVAEAVDKDVDEKTRTLARFLDREDAEALSELASELQQGGLSEHDLIVASRAGAARMATLVFGDPSIIRKLPELIPTDEEGRNQLLSEVIRFAASDAFLALRRKLGLDLS